MHVYNGSKRANVNPTDGQSLNTGAKLQWVYDLIT